MKLRTCRLSEKLKSICQTSNPILGIGGRLRIGEKRWLLKMLTDKVSHGYLDLPEGTTEDAQTVPTLVPPRPRYIPSPSGNAA